MADQTGKTRLEQGTLDVAQIIQRTITCLLYYFGKIPEVEVDINFDTPTKDRLESLTRPTIDLFLFDIRENMELRVTDWQSANGKNLNRIPPRRFDLKFMISVHRVEPEIEHLLLLQILKPLVKYPQLSKEELVEWWRKLKHPDKKQTEWTEKWRELMPNGVVELMDALQSFDPPLTARIANQDESGRLLDLWNALGTTPHPALCYIVTIPLDLEIEETAPLVLSRLIHYQHMGLGEGVATNVSEKPMAGLKFKSKLVEGQYEEVVETVVSGIRVGTVTGIVRNKKGKPVTDATISTDRNAVGSDVTDQEGRYVLYGLTGGTVVFFVSINGKIIKQVPINIPSETYDIVIDE